MTDHSRRRASCWRLLAGALLLTLLPLTAVAKDPSDGAAPPAVELFVSDSAAGWTLNALNPATLGDRADRPGVEFAVGTTPASAVLSTDGSTLVSLRGNGKIVVREGLAGPERTEFSPQAYVEASIPGALTLSRDGARLVVRIDQDFSEANLQFPAWKVFDTADGRLLAAVQGEPGDQQMQVDAEGRRLYRLVVPASGAGPEEATEPTTAVVIAHDLTTGAEIGRLELPDVRAGFWRTDRSFAFDGGEEPVMAQLLPGFAISPDGRRLAVVHADKEALTLVDAERLTIERAVGLTQPRGWLARLAGLLPLAPQTAAAKAIEGTALQAVFAADGRHLYIIGDEASMASDGPTFRGLGIRVLDIAEGEVTAEALPDALIERVLPAPDGRGVYVFGPTSTTGFAEGNELGYALRWLDPITLETQAEREFPGYRWFLLRSAAADPALPLTVELLDHAFTPDRLTIPAGADVQLRVVNHGAMPHTFTVGDDSRTLSDVKLGPGEATTITLNAPVGEYKLVCGVKGHAEAGMAGMIVAE